MMQPASAPAHTGMSSTFGRDGQHPHVPGNSFAYGMPQASFAPNHANHQPGMVALNNAFAGISVQDGMGYRGPDMAVPALTMANPPLNLVPNNPGHQHQALFFMHNGVLYAPTSVSPLTGLPAAGAMPAGAPAVAMTDRPHPRGAQYERQPGIAHQEYGPVPFTPSPRNFAPMQEPAAGEPPGLETRQVSLGSHSDSEQVSSPDTPDGLDTNRLGHNVIIARTDLSPIVQYGYGVPSPQHFLPTFEQAQAAKPLALRSLAGNIVAVANAASAIPRAVPAVSTCRKTLQSCFENPTGTTNVYIRGLHPNTTDEMLLNYASRFGHVANSKAMIDNQTGACKGFGFACFRSLDEAHNCIRGFYAHGYEVSFARESFNARLKSFADPSSTNLYVSNLPRSMTETELAAVFHEYKVQSSRIIRDAQGHSKGVGFARFGSREECDEIIKKYHGKPVGQEQLLLQVRYADTPEQKRLKHETQKRREFRANEYNAVAYGTPAYYPFRPVRGSLVGASLSAPCARHVDIPWVGISTPPNSVGRMNKAETPTRNNSQDVENKSHSEAESKATQGANTGDSAPASTNTPTIAYGDTYSCPTVAASA